MTVPAPLLLWIVYMSAVVGVWVCDCVWVSLVAQTIKNLPAMQETQVQSLGREDSPRDGHGNPPQYSCLENSMDRGAWRATVHGVAKSPTRLGD